VPRGFTLVELLIVLVIGGLALSLVPPLFSKGATSVELRSAARELAAALRYARSRAINRHVESTVTVNVADKRYEISGRKGTRTLPQGADIKLDTARSQTRSKTLGRFDSTRTAARRAARSPSRTGPYAMSSISVG